MINVPLKEGAELKAHRRMIRAGDKPVSVRKRILLLATERGLPKKDVERALKASLGRRRGFLIDFALAHGINLNWLLFGDIRGLREMVREAS